MVYRGKYERKTAKQDVYVDLCPWIFLSELQPIAHTFTFSTDLVLIEQYSL